VTQFHDAVASASFLAALEEAITAQGR